jgi:hypothetical protein
MEYDELDHIKDKAPEVGAIYERLIVELRKFGLSKLNQKRQAYTLETGLGLREYTPVRTISSLKFI